MKKLLIILLVIFIASLFIGCNPKFSLTITIVGAGTITANGENVTSETPMLFSGDTEVELVVTPNNGFQFQGWTGTNGTDVTGTANPYAIIMNGDKVLTATFIQTNIISLSATPTTLNESVANDGSLNPNIITITVTNSTFIQAQILPVNITATGLPAGLSLASPTYVDATHITVEVDGNATNHQNADDTTFTITVADVSITDATADVITGNITLDFVDVPESPLEDWETNTFTKYPWVLGGQVNPTLTNTHNHTTSGTYSATAVLNNSENGYFAIRANVQVAGDMTFYFLASTDSSPTYIWDGLNVYVDGNFVEHYNNFDCGGNGATACTIWTQQTVPLTVGYHKIVFFFLRDNGGSFGDNAVWVDDISLPLGTGLSSDVNVDPDILVASNLYPVVEVPNGATQNLGEIAQGSTSGNTLTFHIRNMGPAELQLTGTAPNYITTTGDTALTVTTQPTNGSLDFYDNVSFTCTINTANVGNFTTNIVIPSNDSDENPYTIPIIYSIIAPYSEADLRYGPFGETNVIAHNSTYDGGNVIATTGATSDIPLRIYNIGFQPFNLTGTAPNYVVWASGSSLLSVGIQPTAGSVASASYIDFKIRFTGNGTTGTYSATFNIPNNETGTTAGIGDGIDETTYTFTINVNSVIPSLSEGFENTTFPPTGWTRYNVDGGGTEWARNTNASYVHTGVGSAYHNYSYVGNQEGWLVTPAIDLTGKTSATLSFWRYDQYPDDYIYHGIWVSTTSNNPTGGSFVEVQNLGVGEESWIQHTIDISAYAGQSTVYIGFLYKGNGADRWYLDDVLVISN